MKKQLKVQFSGEEGVDEGGVQKEFFQLAIRELFDVKYGIFEANEDSRLFWFTKWIPPTAAADTDNTVERDELKLVGRLIGLAIYNSVILDV